MRPIPDIKGYGFSSDISVNASICMLRLNKRMRQLSPGYKPTTFFQKRIQNKKASRRIGTRIVR